MKKIACFAIAAITMLTGCHTTKSVLAAMYDERPENKQPVLERPAWPNYDLHDDRSFAAFSHIQTARKGEGKRLQEEGGSLTSGAYTLYRCKDATYLAYDWTVPSSQDWFFWRFTSGSALIDADTGDRYLLQGLEHFPIDQCFWIYGQSNETIRLVLVFPPLPSSVKRIKLYEASAESRRWMDGKGMITNLSTSTTCAPTLRQNNPQRNKGALSAKPRNLQKDFFHRKLLINTRDSWRPL